MDSNPKSLENLIKEFTRLPGIGRKTAQRLSYFVLKNPREEAVSFAKAIVAAKDNIRFCGECYNFAEEDLCTICSDTRRDRSLICVVERASDIPIIEKGGRYKGVFHVLGGVLSPLSRIGTEDIRIKELLTRIKDEVVEIIIALNPSVEGEATTLYLTKLIKPLDVKLSRLAQGLPAGGELEFTDELTLSRALEGRVTI